MPKGAVVSINDRNSGFLLSTSQFIVGLGLCLTGAATSTGVATLASAWRSGKYTYSSNARNFNTSQYLKEMGLGGLNGLVTSLFGNWSGELFADTQNFSEELTPFTSSIAFGRVLSRLTNRLAETMLEHGELPDFNAMTSSLFQDIMVGELNGGISLYVMDTIFPYTKDLPIFMGNVAVFGLSAAAGQGAGAIADNAFAGRPLLNGVGEAGMDGLILGGALGARPFSNNREGFSALISANLIVNAVRPEDRNSRLVTLIGMLEYFNNCQSSKIRADFDISYFLKVAQETLLECAITSESMNDNLLALLNRLLLLFMKCGVKAVVQDNDKSYVKNDSYLKSKSALYFLYFGFDFMQLIASRHGVDEAEQARQDLHSLAAQQKSAIEQRLQSLQHTGVSANDVRNNSLNISNYSLIVQAAKELFELSVLLESDSPTNWLKLSYQYLSPTVKQNLSYEDFQSAVISTVAVNVIWPMLGWVKWIDIEDSLRDQILLPWLTLMRLPEGMMLSELRDSVASSAYDLGYKDSRKHWQKHIKHYTYPHTIGTSHLQLGEILKGKSHITIPTELEVPEHEEREFIDSLYASVGSFFGRSADNLRRGTIKYVRRHRDDMVECLPEDQRTENALAKVADMLQSIREHKPCNAFELQVLARMLRVCFLVIAIEQDSISNLAKVSGAGHENQHPLVLFKQTNNEVASYYSACKM